MFSSRVPSLLRAAIPIFIGITIVSIYVLFSKNFVCCDWGNCESIPMNLRGALPIEDIDKLKITSSDGADIAKSFFTIIAPFVASPILDMVIELMAREVVLVQPLR